MSGEISSAPSVLWIEHPATKLALPPKSVPFRDGLSDQFASQVTRAGFAHLERAELRESLVAAKGLWERRRPEVTGKLTARIGCELVQIRLAPNIAQRNLAIPGIPRLNPEL